jgi:transcriptional regulator with XRE-family HTH domain
MKARQFKFNGLMVRMLREHMGLSTTELANRTGLSTANILSIEAGKNRDPRLSTMCALAQALGVEVQQLIFEVPQT